MYSREKKARVGTNLFQVQRNSNVLVLRPVKERRALPPLVGTIYGVVDGMPFPMVMAEVVAHSAPAFFLDPAEFLSATLPARRVRRD